MIWAILALQALAPFIHAHAGALHPAHAHGPHLHQLTSGATGDTVVHGEPAVTVAVAQAITGARDLASDASASPLVPRGIPRTPVAPTVPATAFLVSPSPHLVPPDHVLPHTLAPPRL